VTTFRLPQTAIIDTRNNLCSTIMDIL
jgi:hypothetical protein